MDSIQDLIRKGALPEARAEIRALCRSRRTGRDDAVRLAYLARQSYMPERAIALLHRRVRGATAGGPPCTSEERAEYGMALAEHGVADEAIEILSKISLKRHPYVFRSLIIAYFRQWRWAETSPIIEGFLRKPGLPEKERLWARYFQGIALLHGLHEFRKSQAILDEVLEAATTLEYRQLREDALQMLTQNHYYQGNWSKARRFLDQLEQLHQPESGTPFSLLVRQWRALIAFHAGRDQAAALREVRSVREAYAALGRYENARYCAFYEVLCLRESQRLLKFYFGTPYPHSRKRILGLLGLTEEQLPAHFDFRLAGAKEEASNRGSVDLLTGQNSFSKTSLRPGKIPLRTLQALCADLYIPPTVPVLFGRLYPGEYFHPTAGPFRVRNAIKRTRKALRKSHVPIRIEERNQEYSLASDSGVLIRITRTADGPGHPMIAGYLAQARAEFGLSFFSVRQFASLIRVSVRSARRHLAEAIAWNRLESAGRGTATRYRVVEHVISRL